MWCLIKRMPKNPFIKQKRTHRTEDASRLPQVTWSWGERKREGGLRHSLSRVEQRSNENLLESTGKSTWEKNEWIYLYVQALHFAVHLELIKKL